MRKILAIVIVLLSFGSKAQVTLGMGPIGVYQDTILAGNSDTYTVWVKNTSFFNFEDNLTMQTAALDSTGTGFNSVGTFSPGGVDTILVGDSLAVSLTTTYAVSPSQYRYGIDVIVVWPVAASAITTDSLTFNVFIIDPAGIQEIDLTSLIKAYPNPVIDRLILGNSSSKTIQNVRVYNMTGKLVLDRMNETCIEMEGLAPGTYTMDVELSDKNHVFLKIIKQKNGSE